MHAVKLFLNEFRLEDEAAEDAEDPALYIGLLAQAPPAPAYGAAPRVWPVLLPFYLPALAKLARRDARV